MEAALVTSHVCTDRRQGDLEALASESKTALGTGGTAKEGRIELQGDHAERVRELLAARGYDVVGARYGIARRP